MTDYIQQDHAATPGIRSADACGFGPPLVIDPTPCNARERISRAIGLLRYLKQDLRTPPTLGLSERQIDALEGDAQARIDEAIEWLRHARRTVRTVIEGKIER
jgi:hypothetical protein